VLLAAVITPYGPAPGLVQPVWRLSASNDHPLLGKPWLARLPLIDLFAILRCILFPEGCYGTSRNEIV